jgi:hypothetical protein
MIEDYNIYINKFSNNLNQELKILKESFKPWNVNFYSKSIILNKQSNTGCCWKWNNY